MTDNARQIIEKMQASFPHLYNVYDKSTILYALLSTFGEKFGTRTDIIDRLYAMIGIDSTYDEDLEHRWGSLLGIYKQIGESYSSYRGRLLIAYSSLAGGTAEAIKYTIASTIGITDNEEIVNKYIHVYDAWKYPHEIDETIIEDTSYGHIICTIDLSANESITMMNDRIMNAINQTKASGIKPYLLFVYTIEELVVLAYNEDTFDKIMDQYGDACSVSSSDNDYVDSILQTIAESGTITSGGDTIFEKYMYANIDDIININMSESISMVMKHIQSDSASLGIDEALIEDVVMSIVQEPSTANSEFNTELWSYIGTNSSVVLNVDFVTNMQMETDSCIDEITYASSDDSNNTTGYNTSVFGSAVFGRAVFGRTY